jgi:hypothetical protein
MATQNKILPADVVLLPVPSGALLVSRSQATFCHIPAQSLPALHRAIAGGVGLEALSPALLHALDLHVFFGDPRSGPPPRDRDACLSHSEMRVLEG